MKIDSCLIVKNEEANIRNVINNLLKFSNHIYIVDTGSTDSTCDIVKSFDKNKVTLDHFVWVNNFAKARNYSISLSKDSDYIFWCDGDEDLLDPMIDKLVELSKMPYSDDLPDVYNYVMVTKNDHNNGINSPEYSRPGLFKTRFGYVFKGIVHENLDVKSGVVDNETFAELGVINHYDKVGIERYRNLNMFGDIKNRGLNCRDLFYYAKELYDVGLYLPCSLLLTEAMFCNVISSEMIDGQFIYIHLWENHEVVRHNKISIEELVDRILKTGMYNKTVLYYYASVLYNNERYEYAVKCAKKAYEMENEGYEQMITEGDYDELANMSIIVCGLDRMGLQMEAYGYNELILKKYPEDETAIYNKEALEKVLLKIE